MNKRQAFSLVEMLVCISVGSVLMGLAIGVVHRSMQAESSASSVANVGRTATLLSSRFRQDAHQAESVTIEGLDSDRTSIEFRLPQKPPVAYRLEKSSLVREQRQDSGQTHRERFAFPDDHLLQVAELSDPPRVVLTVIQETGLVGVPPQCRLHVETVVGQFFSPSSSTEVSP